MVGLKRGKVKVFPYSPEWAKVFETEKKKLQNALQETLVDIQHVGSTAIPGMSAKPIIDIGVAVPKLNKREIKKYIEPLEKLGYKYMGEERSRNNQREHLFIKGSEKKRLCYLHMVEFDSLVWKNYLLFRDYLCDNRKAKDEYIKLKLKLAKKFLDDRKLYTDGKEKFIKELLKKARKSYRAEKVINLNKKFSVVLIPKGPYNFDATIHKPSHFPSSDNKWSKGKYWITMVWKRKYLGLKLENKGTANKPKIKLAVYSKEVLSKEYKKSLISEIEWRFNLKSDISEFNKKFKKDKILGPLLKRWQGMKPVAANSFYETTVIYIVLQNAVIRRSVQMLENLFNKFGKKVKFDNKILSTFWQLKIINKVSEQELRDLRLGYRAKFLKKISSQFAKGEIDEFKMRKMDKEELKNEALKLYGIGPASAEYLLFEDFYHYDALETIPPWEQKIMSKLLFNKKLVSVEKILNFFRKKYPNWEKLAFHYIWEDIFWKRKTKYIDWLEKEIRL